MGAAIEKNFFWFYFLVSPILFLLVFYFFIFSDFRLDSCFDSVFQIILFNYFDSIKIRHLILDFIFQTPYRLNSHTSFARYLLVCDSRIRFWFSTRINFDLFQHCRFYSSTLYLFDSSACYKQTSMLMWVWFMLVLAILRLSDVFSFVLGVVYRLGLK